MYEKIMNDINTHILSERLFRRGNRGSGISTINTNVEIITWNSPLFYQIARFIK